MTPVDSAGYILCLQCNQYYPADTVHKCEPGVLYCLRCGVKYPEGTLHVCYVPQDTLNETNRLLEMILKELQTIRMKMP